MFTQLLRTTTLVRHAGPVAAVASAALGGALVLSSVAGCGQSSAKQTATSDTQSAPATADEWLARMTSAYRTAQRYSDSGTLHLTFVHGAARQKIDETVDFSVTLERPNRLRIHCYQAIVVADGKDLYATIGELEGQVLHLPCPAEIAGETLFKDPSLAQALTQIAGSPPQIALLLGDKFLDAIREGAESSKLLDPRTIDDRTCRGVEIKRGDGGLVLWIDEKSSLLRRIEFPTSGLAKYLEEQIGEPISGATLVADLRGATIEAPIDDVAFRFEVPAEAKLVSQFDRRQPPLPPSALLGQPAPDFKFTGLDGAQITREALAGKVVVLDFWATWCQPCLESLPNLQQVYERFKTNDKVVICAVNIDQPDITDAQVRETFVQRKLSIPISRDSEQMAQTGFQVASIPNLFVIGPDGIVAHNEVGFNPNLAAELPDKLDKLLAGEAIHQQTLDDYKARKAEFDATFGQTTPTDAPSQGEEPPGRVEIAARSEPASHQLTKLWTAEGIEKPGNIMVVGSGADVRLFVNDGWKRVIELDSAGKTIANHELRVPELSVVSFLRTVSTGDGTRWFAGSANTQRQMHLFDQDWNTRWSYPPDGDAEISDVQLADLDGDGQFEVCISYWGNRGIEVLDQAGKVHWRADGLENVFRLAIIGPEGAPKTILASHARGTLAEFDSLGKRGAEITIPDRFIRSITAADLTGDGTVELCGLSPVAQDRDVLVGITPQGELLWSYELPSGLHEQPLEMIAAGRVIDDSGQWIVAAADGSIQLLSAEGQLVDRFHCGSAITGLAAAEIDGQPALLVASTEGLAACRLVKRTTP